MGRLSNALRLKPAKQLVELEEGILDALNEIAEIRGIPADTIVKMQLLSYIRAFEKCKILSLADKMPYGKYESFTVEDVIRMDPRYINYLIANSETFKLSDEALELVKGLS